MIEGVVVCDFVNKYGIRHVHIIHGGCRVNIEPVLKFYGIIQEELIAINEYFDEDVQMWNLHLIWKVDGSWAEWEKIDKRKLVSISIKGSWSI